MTADHHNVRKRPLDAFSVVGDPVKRRIVALTVRNEWCVNELMTELGITQPAVSKHLRALREAGILAVRIDGQRRWYRVVPGAFEPLESWLAELDLKASNVIQFPSDAANATSGVHASTDGGSDDSSV